ncbi:MAG: helix-hairpin-helix domain-containing protein [Gammaproteobacteria bacterium]|nr:helix-hairpin-helix domain-containing protein [Gammaproteobacteria bacterium]
MKVFIKLVFAIVIFLLANIYSAKPNQYADKHEKNLIKSITLAEPVNINTATILELIKLNGIGEKKAQAIITYRNANGPFKSIKEIKKVPGVSKSVFNKIKSVIMV